MVPNHIPDPALSERGRKNVARRWENASQDEKNEAAARARAGMRQKAIQRAKELAGRLGITLNGSEAETAGAALLKREQAERATEARVAAQAVRAAQKAENDADWATDRLIAYAALMRTWAPAVPSHEQANILAMAVRDELDAPDGFSRPRLIRRLNALVEYVKAQAAERSRQLAQPGDAAGFDDLFDSVGKPDPGRRSGPVSDLSADEQAELLDQS